jgi:hypothetical protein
MCARISTRHCAINTWQIWSWVCLAREEGCSPASTVLSGEKNRSKVLKSVLGIRDILPRIRIRGSIPLTNGSGSVSCYFRQWFLRWQLKINFLTKFFCLLLFETTLTSFSKIKSHKESENRRSEGFSYQFSFMIEGFRSVPRSNGSASGSPKNIRIPNTG